MAFGPKTSNTATTTSQRELDTMSIDSSSTLTNPSLPTSAFSSPPKKRGGLFGKLASLRKPYEPTEADRILMERHKVTPEEAKRFVESQPAGGLTLPGSGMSGFAVASGGAMGYSQGREKMRPYREDEQAEKEAKARAKAMKKGQA